MSKKALIFTATLLVSLVGVNYVNRAVQPTKQIMLNRAAAHGDTGMMRFLLFIGADANRFTELGSMCANDDSGIMSIDYPLQKAAGQGQDKAVELLLGYGAQINAPDEFGRTALWHAALGGHVDTVRLLIAQGANVHVPQFDGSLSTTPLEQAAQGGETEVVRILLETGAGKNGHSDAALWHAVGFDHEGTAELLIEYGADVNYVDRSTGWSVLLNADETAIIGLLKRAGAKESPEVMR